MSVTIRSRFPAIEIALASIFLAPTSGCGGQRDLGVAPAFRAPDVAAAPTSAGVHLGDVATIASQGAFLQLAWDDSDAMLVGTKRSYSGYGGAAPVVVFGASGKFQFPAAANGVAYDDKSGAFYFSSGHNLYASKADGSLTTVTAALGGAASLALDPSSGDVYVIDGNRIDRFRDGKLSPFSRPGTVTPAVDGVPGTPSIAFDSKQRVVYLADTFGDAVKRILPDGTAAVVAGHCQRLRSGIGGCEVGNVPGTGKRALFGAPSGIIFDARNDDFIVADASNNVLWRVTRSGDAAPVAGYGPSARYDGNAWRAFFALPGAMTYSSKLGAAFVSDSGRTARYALVGPKPAPLASPTSRFVFSKVPPNTLSTPVVDGSAAWIAINGRLMRVTTSGMWSSVSIPGSVRQVALDRAGNLWASYSAFGKSVGVARLDVSGTVTRFSIETKDRTSDISALAIGPDGNPWFGFSNVKPAIGTVQSNVVKLFGLPNPRPGVPRPGPIVAGPDGTIWYSYGRKNEIQRISTDGERLPPVKSPFYPRTMAVDRGTGDVWFLDGEKNVVYRLNDDSFSSYPFGCSGCSFEGEDLTVSPDDTAWVATNDTMTGISRSGKVKEYYLPLVHAGAAAIAAASAHAVWVAGYSGQMFLFDPIQYARARLPLVQP